MHLAYKASNKYLSDKNTPNDKSQARVYDSYENYLHRKTKDNKKSIPHTQLSEKSPIIDIKSVKNCQSSYL